MANFNFTVDTNPMADSIDGVANHVDGTTAAVIAMQTAVVIAEQKGAEKICNNVNFGFYSLIRSQIFQKIATHKSKADAKIMELQQQSVSLIAIKSRMEKDYQMLASRYTKLFEGLNKALRARIFELDKPTTNFVLKDVLPTANRTKRLSGSTSTTQVESIASGQMISVSNTKYNAMKNISSMQDFIYSSENQKNLIGSILNKESVSKPTEKDIPVLISESEGLNVRQSQWMITQPPLKKNTNSKIESHIYSTLTNLKWVDDDQSNSSRVKQEFGDFVNQSTVSDRVKKQMLSLLESSKWQKLNS
ncbi:MAG: hypothetical protein IPP77_02760 [Bacteroidetes bacterium]|nr:hypothetical protein [Bacteroidota bacterium]